MKTKKTSEFALNKTTICSLNNMDMGAIWGGTCDTVTLIPSCPAVGCGVLPTVDKDSSFCGG